MSENFYFSFGMLLDFSQGIAISLLGDFFEEGNLFGWIVLSKILNHYPNTFDTQKKIGVSKVYIKYTIWIFILWRNIAGDIYN